MSKTAIEWTDHSLSPIRARNKATGKVFHFCEKVSPGCANCYAETLAKRFGLYEYHKRNRDKVELFLDESKLQEVLRRRKPTTYFWEDCSDLFGDWVPDDWIDQCFGTMALASHHTHQVLTKRPERMAAWFARPGWTDRIYEACRWVADIADIDDWLWDDLNFLPNVWLGCSIENQTTADERIPHLLCCPGAVRFLSCEPLLGPLNLENYLPSPRGDSVAGERCHNIGPQIGWVIVGGESGPKARPMHPDWARSLRDQCQTAGVPFFFKQWGTYLPVPIVDDPTFAGGRAFDSPRGGRVAAVLREKSTKAFMSGKYRPLKAGDRNGHGIMLDDNTLACNVGKKAAGRLLDGLEWNEMPLIGKAAVHA